MDILTNTLLNKITKNGVSVLNRKTLEEKTIEIDTVVIAKTRPREINDNGLADTLKTLVKEIYLIGDCTSITTPNTHYNIKNAMYQGHRVAHLI